MADALADLRAKLEKRRGRTGFAINVREIERLIEAAEAEGYVYRDAGSGHYVTREYAKANKGTTYRTKIQK